MQTVQTVFCEVAVELVNGVPYCASGFQIIDSVVSTYASLGNAFQWGFYHMFGIVLLARIVNIVASSFNEER